MPSEKGRSGRPGSDTTYRNIGIRMPKPEILQPGKKKPGNMSPKKGSRKSY